MGTCYWVDVTITAGAQATALRGAPAPEAVGLSADAGTSKGKKRVAAADDDQEDHDPQKKPKAAPKSAAARA
jgi:hypothetical protein